MSTHTITLNVHLPLHEGHLKLIGMDYEVLVLMAGRRWAKTQMGIHSLIQGTIKPNSTNWYVAPTRIQAKEIVWRRLIEVFPKNMIARINETELFLDTKITNARIAVKGADHEDGLLGSGLDLLIVDEAQDIKPHVWPRVLRPMLIGRKGKALLIGTKRPRSWFRDLWRTVHRGEMGQGYKCAWYPSTSNPIVSKEEWAKVRKEVGESVWMQEFVSDPLSEDGDAEQIKYAEFNRKDHIVSYFEIPEHWRRFIFIDWGRNHMSAVLWAALSPKNNLYVNDEMRVNGKSPEAVADLLLQKNGKKPITACIIDPSTQRSEADGISVFERMRKILGRLFPGRREDRVHSGSTLVKNFLRPVNGPPKLYITPNCTALIEELENLEWESAVNDDLTDALRYGIGFVNQTMASSSYSGGNLDQIPDGIVYEDNLRITYKEGHLLKMEALKKTGGRNDGTNFDDLCESV